MQVKKALVTVTGSKVDDDAVELACWIAKRNKAKLFVIYVIEVAREHPVDAALQTEIAKAEEVLDRAERIAEKMDFEAKTELLQAREAGPAVVDLAVQRGVDLILMGMGYKRKFGQFSLGSTTPYVLKNAPCNVMIFREPMGEETSGS